MCLDGLRALGWFEMAGQAERTSGTTAQNAPTRCRCGAELQQPATGRPRLTCSEACRRADDAERKRARRVPEASAHQVIFSNRPATVADTLSGIGNVADLTKTEPRNLSESSGRFAQAESDPRPDTEATGLQRAAKLLRDATRLLAEREAEAMKVAQRWGYSLIAWGPDSERQYRFVRS